MIYFVNHLAELVSLVVAIIYYPYLKHSFMKWVLPFLCIIFFGELYARYNFFSEKNAVGTNYIIATAESVFYGYVFYKLSSNNLIKKGILVLILISILGYAFSYLFSPESISILYINLVASGLILSIISMTYLYSKFLKDDKTYLILEPEFWIAFGVTIFFSGVSIVFSVYNISLKHNLKIFGARLHHIIPIVLCVILYSSISIAIILCKRKIRISE